MRGWWWDDVLDYAIEDGWDYPLFWVGILSQNNFRYDIKADSNMAPHGPGTGKVMSGYYFSARSIGNYLAGFNAGLRGMKFENFMRIAGALHVGDGKIDKFVKAGLSSTLGTQYGTAPWYGEHDYCGRMAEAGYLNSIGEKNEFDE